MNRRITNELSEPKNVEKNDKILPTGLNADAVDNLPAEASDLRKNKKMQVSASNFGLDPVIQYPWNNHHSIRIEL